MVLNQLPQEWALDSFSNLNDYQSSTMQPEKFIGETFELFSVPIFPEGQPEILKAEEIGSTKQFVKNNDVLVCKINPRINRVWSVKRFQNFPQIASSEWIVFRQHHLDSQFYTWYFRSDSFRELLCADVTGVGGSLTRAQPKQVAKFPVPVPPLAEQKVIADKLDTLLAQVDNTKARLERIPEILKSFRQSVLAAAVSGKLTEEWREKHKHLTTKGMLEKYKPLPRPARWNSRSDSSIRGVYATSVGDPGLSPVLEWEWVQLVDIAKMESGHTPSRSKPEYWGGNVCWIGIKDANLNHTKTIFDTEQKTNELGLANSASRLLPENTVCISRTASVGYVVKMGKPMATSQDFVNWIPSSVVNPDWLKWLFVAERESLFRFGKGSTHTTVYFPEWLSMYILLPHKTEQTEIVRRVEELFAFANRIEQAAQAAQSRVNNLTQSILAKAFRGELTADWRAANLELISGDNSAEALLAKIKAERAKVKTRKKN